MKKAKKQKKNQETSLNVDDDGGARLITQILGKSDKDGLWTASLDKVEELVKQGLYKMEDAFPEDVAALDFARKHPGIQFHLWDFGEDEAVVADLWVTIDTKALDRQLINDFLLFTVLHGYSFALLPNDLWVAFQ